MDYVLGYTCVNDITARDLQRKDGQWTRGKGFDTFCAVRPLHDARAKTLTGAGSSYALSLTAIKNRKPP